MCPEIPDYKMTKLNTRNIITSVWDISSSWAFCHLLNLSPSVLSGGDYKILSPFSNEKTPSFSIYQRNQVYYYKCFSTSRSGSFLDLAIELKLKRGIAANKETEAFLLINAYSAHLNGVGYLQATEALEVNGKGKVSSFELRKFNEEDLGFWGQFGITMPILEEYNVSPIKVFTIEKLKDGNLNQYIFSHAKIYGYFRKTGNLHKIYRPGKKVGKCIKVGTGYIEGDDQIQTKQDNLLIIKSTKDIMGFKSLGIKGWDAVAPDSENVILPKQYLQNQKQNYKNILTFLDNDDAGKKATEKYKMLHQIESINFDLGAKDLTDTIKDKGANFVRAYLQQSL